MQRRDLIINSAGITFSLTLPSLYTYKPNVEADQYQVEPHTLARIWDAQLIYNIGFAYLSKAPQENSIYKLMRLLFRNIPKEIKVLKKYIEQKIELECKNGNIVIIDGQFLSLTEARQCALFLLIQYEK